MDIYEAVLDRPLDLKIYGWEVVSVRLRDRRGGPLDDIVPHLREYLERKKAASQA